MTFFPQIFSHTDHKINPLEYLIIKRKLMFTLVQRMKYILELLDPMCSK